VAHRPRQLLVGALPLVLMLTACGGGKPKADATPTGSMSAFPGVTESASAGPGSSSSGAPSGGPSGFTPAPGPSGTAVSPGTSVPPASGSASPARPAPIDVKASVAHGCVTPGGSQRVDVTTLPDAVVVIDTLYSDGKDGQVHGGIKPNGRADSTGHFSFAWTVLPGTPSGEAKITVATGKSGRSGSTTATFQVKTVC
jgi:hypothetical protein